MRTNWNRRAKLYDRLEASDLRRADGKRSLFEGMRGKTLFLAVGTGVDFGHFPPSTPSLIVVGIDISEEMLRRAATRATTRGCSIRLAQCDAAALCFANDCFDTVVTSCTLCSVPDPRKVVMELHRVLRPSGKLLLFEHVRSRHPLFALALDAMNVFTRRGGTEMNRDTVGLLAHEGFRVERIESVFMDIILSVTASKAQAPSSEVGLPPGLRQTVKTLFAVR